MYAGIRYTADASESAFVYFSCAHCGQEAPARVIGRGEGGGASPFFLNNSGGRDEAVANAVQAAQVNAALTVKLAKCPKCGKRDEVAVQRVKLKAAAGAGMGFAIAVVFGQLLHTVDQPSGVFWVVLVGGIGLAGFVYWRQRWKWKTVDERVCFVDEQRGDSAPATEASLGR